MSKLVWNGLGDNKFEMGVDRGVLYVSGQPGVAWNGLISVKESSSGSGVKKYYMDGVVYLQRQKPEEFSATIQAFQSPTQFDECDGTKQLFPGLQVKQQRRKEFGLCYRSMKQDSRQTQNFYKLHLIYNVMAEPAERVYESLNPQQEPMTLSWDVSTKATVVPGALRSASLVIDSEYADPSALANIETILYGSDTEVPRLPDPTEIVSIFTTEFDFAVTDIGGGLFTIRGPADVVIFESDGVYTIDRSTVAMIDSDTATISD